MEYLAGIFDGEGHIAHVGEYKWRLVLDNTDRSLMDWVVDNFGGALRPMKRRTSGLVLSNKICYRWQLACVSAGLPFLQRLADVCIVKKPALLEMLNVLKSRDAFTRHLPKTSHP